MKRRVYEISIAGQVVATRHAWNTARTQAIYSAIDYAKADEARLGEMVDVVHDGRDHVSGVVVVKTNKADVRVQINRVK